MFPFQFCGVASLFQSVFFFFVSDAFGVFPSGFQVFEPVIGKELMPDELIEGELINPTSSLAQLHIRLLKV